MWNEQKMYNYLEKNLKEARLRHSLSVSKTAELLAAQYDQNIEKARIAGLIHDCAKNLTDVQFIKVVTDHGIVINETERQNPSILHGLVGSLIAKEEMGICDENILMSIRYHTTGRKNMSILEKIIYIADYIEPLRQFSGVDELRCLIEIDLDSAILKSFDNSINYVISKNGMLHTDTIDARNYLLSKNSRCE
ncbi:bis(5'-nucleosyl)-tetraphosphatase (symmetrical) YqeK [Clostridium lacusfryxellense]|uniref:bis(5'-nucleosyl)-tetraphosphatase (symmetrical) YqeK n=1 Tax=Clostridium lacusfryxellense TaxID=205328 RepID=UPI001C0B612A|nr:bis(5'-nucleosyl)-tetraphosphatase (symmetrical) YqeK [Clostridium lacusfryxellense]MBU3110433.1 bis(5'-nucleosyl)-tetraphosphatase (symmetrical) YqeK [Clostridium lacusfryxellense]